MKKKTKEDFVHLHVHSDMSQLDGCGKIADYAQRAKDMGHDAIALTEHGTMRQYFTQLEECQEREIKPIYGIEFYIARDMRRKGLTEEEKSQITSGLKVSERKAAIREYEDREGIRDRWHLTVLAKNEVGLKNLFKLSTKGWLEGFYYKPRIDVEELIKHKEGLIVATGCQSSVVMDYVCVGKKKKALKEAERLYSEFGDNLWLEVMPHEGRDQIAANEFALELYERWGRKVGLLATQDAHYVDVTDSEAHEALLCIGTGDSMKNPDRFRFGDGELYLKSRKQMFRSFVENHPYMSKNIIKSSLNNTVEVANLIDDNIINIDRFACLMPPVDVPSKFGGDEFAYTKALCIHGWTWREIPKRAEVYAKRNKITYEEAIRIYKARLKHELGAIERQRFITYFLLVRDIYNWARKQDIMCGPGRGSAAGSLIAFLLGITSVDPVEHALLFERFINPARVDMPDIDMDFEDVRRQEIIQYLRDKYGEDRVSQIATVGRLSGKQCLKDVSRVLEVPYAAVNEVTNSIIERSSGDERASQTIEDSFRDFAVCRAFDAKYPDVLRYSKKLEGMSKNLGIHAAGVVTSPVPLVEITPLEVRKHSDGDVVVTAVDMNGVGAHGLLKLDVLGLRTLTVLKDAVRAIRERHKIEVDLERLELNDPKVLQAFTDHDYTGIFQYDSPSADKICMGVTFDSFEDVAAMTALNRPGTARSGLATEYVERKKHPEKRKTGHFHPKVSEITSDTMGVIVYQEHVQKIFVEIAGFPPGTADSLRKKIAKKYGDETIGKERENFIRGAKEHSGIDEETAGKIMDAITFFGSYGFNKSHATSYGVIAYWGMWLKVYYPLEFYWALLKNTPDRIRIQGFAKDAKRHGVELLPPDVSVSKREFAIDPNKTAIRGSLVDIKGVGQSASENIMQNQPYSDFADFLDRIERRKVHKGVVTALAKSGALNELVSNIKWLIENIETFWKKYLKNKKEKLEALADLEASKELGDYAEEERQLIASQVNPLAFGRHPIDAYGDFMKKNLKVDTVMMSDDGFWVDNNDRGIFICGVIIEVKYNQIGDFHTGELPPEDERRKMFWGHRYANVNVEDAGGSQNRIKFDIDIFDGMRELIDSGIGTPVIVHAVPNKQYENLRAHFAVDLEKLRKKIDSGSELDVWERIVVGKHPAKVKKWKAKGNMGADMVKKQRVKNDLFFKGRTRKFTGVVMQCRLKYDKKDHLMAFFSMLDAAGNSIDCICFASNWDPKMEKIIKAGNLLSIELDRQRDMRNKTKWQYFFNGGNIHWYKKSSE
jgi:DNA polymerase-3 subunit alpha